MAVSPEWLEKGRQFLLLQKQKEAAQNNSNYEQDPDAKMMQDNEQSDSDSLNAPLGPAIVSHTPSRLLDLLREGNKSTTSQSPVDDGSVDLSKVDASDQPYETTSDQKDIEEKSAKNNADSDAQAAVDKAANQENEEDESVEAPKEDSVSGVAKKEDAPVEEEPVDTTETTFKPGQTEDNSPSFLSKILGGLQPKTDLEALRQQQMGNQILRGAALIGHGLAHAPGTPDLSNLQKESTEATQMYLLKQEANKEDPNSDYSKAFRGFAESLLGKKLPDNVSAAQLEKIMPYATLQVKNELATNRLLSGIQAKTQGQIDVENAKQGGRKEIKEMDIESREKIAQQKAQAALGRQLNGDENKFINTLTTAKSKRGFLGEPTLITQRVSELQNDLNRYKNWDEIPSNLKDEYIQLFAGIGTMGGAGTDVKFKAIDPKTAEGRVRETWQYLSGNPTGTGQGAFLKEFMSSANSRANTAQNIINDEYIKLGKKEERILGPDVVKKILSTEGIDPDVYDKFDAKNTTIQKSLGKSESLPDSNMVKIQTPDGRIMKLPKENLAKAIEKGAKVVQ